MSPSALAVVPAPLGAALRAIPWYSLLVDVAVVVAWVAVVSVAARVTASPMWVYYVVVFGGVVAYSLARTAVRTVRGR